MTMSFSYKNDKDGKIAKRRVYVLYQDDNHIAGIDLAYLKGDRAAQRAVKSVKVDTKTKLVAGTPEYNALTPYMKYYRNFKISNIR